MKTTPPPSWEPWLAALAVTLVLGVSAPFMPMVWDEGDYLARASEIRGWGGRVVCLQRDDDRGCGFSELTAAGISRGWRTTTHEEGHPALGLTLFALVQAVCGSWFSPLVAARLATVLLVAIAAGAMYARVRSDAGRHAAIAAVVAWMLMPRSFAHAQFATLDAPLTALWVTVWAMFPWGERGRWQAVGWGAVLGCGLAIKFSGWLIPIPFLLIACLWPKRETWRTLLLGLPTAVAVFWLLNPPLWHDPVGGMSEFFRLNLGRREHFNLSGYFFGEMYDLDHPLPWFNGLVWAVVVVPLPIYLFAVLKPAHAIRSLVSRDGSNRFHALLAANWALLLVVRGIPGAPVHDNERLILPSFAFLAVFAGLGWGWLWNWAASLPRFRRALRVALVALLVSPFSSLAWYYPQCLSYYSLTVGGLRGAVAMGMEPTYYWDAFDAEVCRWLAENTPPDGWVRFSAGSLYNLEYQRQSGFLPRDYVDFSEPAAAPFHWYVLQHRPSGYSEIDLWLLDQAQPAWQKTIRPATWGWGVWRLDVPILSIYSAADYRRAVAAVSTE